MAGAAGRPKRRKSSSQAATGNGNDAPKRADASDLDPSTTPRQDEDAEPMEAVDPASKKRKSSSLPATGHRKDASNAADTPDADPSTTPRQGKDTDPMESVDSTSDRDDSTADGRSSAGTDDDDDDDDDNDDDDNGRPPTPPPPPPNPYDGIRRAIVRNDGARHNVIRLVGLKTLFAKQLPKMPKEYIARLVFDRRHTSLALLSQDPSKRECDDEVIGGICYRAYPDMRFAEIAFCAVSASQQVKGYGTKLMNLFKMHAVTEGIEFFITYADNYAIGYFKKQGFTKAIQMPKGRYQGLIKDYDGGTLMECYVHPSIDFTRVPEIVAAQRQFVLDRLRATTSKSDKIVYDPLPPDFAKKTADATKARGGTNKAAELAMAIPGVAEAGWTMADLVTMTRSAKDSDQKKHLLKKELLSLLNKVSDQHFAWCFRDPVNTEEVKDYLEVIKEPMDLRTIEKRIRKRDWYKNKSMLYSDMMKMVDNCKLYNGEGNTYYEHAVSLQKYLATIFPKNKTSAAVLEGGSSGGGK